MNRIGRRVIMCMVLIAGVALACGGVNPASM
jgi:hypothetical protein